MLKKLGLIFILFLIQCSSIDIAVNEQKKSSLKRIKKIAVLPFDITDADWGDEFADSIGHNFIKEKRFEVMDRKNIENIMKERKLSMTGIVDTPANIKSLSLQGVEAILVGTGKSLKKDNKGNPLEHNLDTFTLKLIDNETGAIIINARKEPGIEWDWGYRLMWALSLSFIWERNDILVKSSNYDNIAKRIAQKIAAEVE